MCYQIAEELGCDLFVLLEEKFYNKYPEYKDKIYTNEK